MAKKPMNFFYDRKGDMLYVSIGKPQTAISKEIGDDVLIRIHPKTEEVVGFTLFNFAERFGDIHEEKSVPLTGKLHLLAQAD